MKTGITTGVLAIALLFAVTANAQKKITLGVKGGGVVSNISDSGVAETMPKYGYTAGVTVDYAVSNNFYILTGLDFTTKGFQTSNGEVVPGVKAEAMYLQLPVHAAVAAHVDQNTKVLFHVGPHVAYGIGGKTKLKGTDIKQDTFSDSSLKKLDLGVGGGITLDYKHLSLGLAYDHSILDIAQDNDLSIRNSAAYLTLGVKF